MKHNGPTLGTGNGGTVIDCQACGYAHLDPLPTLVELDKLYQDQYYQVHNAGFTHKAHESHFDEQGEDIVWHKIAFREQLDTLKHLVPEKTILDYGAGAGWFAKYARDAMWPVCAVEPSPAAVEYANDVVGTALLKKLPDDKRKFGAIRLSYVLEHLPDPCQMLLDLRKYLVDRGVVCIIVPNEFNAWACGGRDRFELDSYWIRPGLHLNYFSHASIASLLRSTGYRVIDQVATFPTELFMLLGGIDFASDPDMGHRVHHLRMDIEKAVERSGLGITKIELYRQLAGRGFGRASVTYAYKVSME